MSSVSLPPLPELKGDVLDICLDLYTHKSVRNPSQSHNPEYGDTDRLADLGAKILNLIVTHHFFAKMPIIKFDEFQTKIQDAVSASRLKEWYQNYSLKDRYIVSDTALMELDTECAYVIHSIIGALYIRNSFDEVQRWIVELVDPGSEIYPILDSAATQQMPAPLPPPDASSPPSPPSFQSSQFYQSNAPSSQSFQTSGHFPPAPTSIPPPVPMQIDPLSSSSSQGSSNNANLSLVSVALMNQTAMQKGCTIEWPSSSTGYAHQPQWTVSCVVSGVVRGQGSGRNQKQAKLEAARIAWQQLGW